MVSRLLHFIEDELRNDPVDERFRLEGAEVDKELDPKQLKGLR